FQDQLYVGLVAAKGDNISFSNIQVDGSISLHLPEQGTYLWVGGISGTAYSVKDSEFFGTIEVSLAMASRQEAWPEQL
ncbi:MAG: hypothetical protein PHP32_07145, partial [Candidatus Izemoplasmatales bacterium]|nr:hypothetical protein [Candidatus Izemoplasmatales bacterium]